MRDFNETMINLLESQRRTLAAMLAIGEPNSGKAAEMEAEIAKLDAEIAELRSEK